MTWGVALLKWVLMIVYCVLEVSLHAARHAEGYGGRLTDLQMIKARSRDIINVPDSYLISSVSVT